MPHSSCTYQDWYVACRRGNRYVNEAMHQNIAIAHVQFFQGINKADNMNKTKSYILKDIS